MTPLQLRIITRAVKIRLDACENIDDILASYTKLTDDERDEIKTAL